MPAPLYAWSRAKGEPVPTAPSVAAAEGHYLQRVITPLFLYLQWQISKRANDHISTRVMYDDVNESFCALPLSLKRAADEGGDGGAEGRAARRLAASTCPHKAPKSEKGRPDFAPRGEPRVVVHADDPNRVAAFTAYEALVEQLAPALSEDEKLTSLGLFGKTYYEVTRGRTCPRVLPRLHVATS